MFISGVTPDEEEAPASVVPLVRNELVLEAAARSGTQHRHLVGSSRVELVAHVGWAARRTTLVSGPCRTRPSTKPRELLVMA
jgi:hypothetical protein